MGINISWTMAKISLIRVEGQTGQSDQNQFLAECLRNSVSESKRTVTAFFICPATLKFLSEILQCYFHDNLKFINFHIKT